MNFQRGRTQEEPEINLIAMIDVLLVILIFLMVTTTFTQISQLEINLPQASAAAQPTDPKAIEVTVDASARFLVNGENIANKSVEGISAALRAAAGSVPEPVIIIKADAGATHQSVVNVMEAARMANYTRITFAAQARSDKE